MKPLRPVYKVLYYILFICFGWAVKLLYRLRTLGRANLPRGGYVLAPNHLKAIDPMYVLLARGLSKKALVMGKEELFEISPLLNFCWNIFGAFPVDRGTGNRQPVDNAIAEVKKGRGLLIFPEGTRSKDGSLGRLKSGAFVVAWQAGVPMVPCIINYSAGGPKLFRRITVAFGQPVTPGQLGMVGEYSPRLLREAKHQYTALLEQLAADNRDRF